MGLRSGASALLPLVVLLWVLSACGPGEAPVPTPTATATAVPQPPAEAALREAFRVADPYARRDAVLLATGRLLRTEALRQAADAVASTYLTDISFSSGQLTLRDPALVRYHGQLAVAAVPEGIGLYLYDLDSPADTLPTELSRWTVGITFLDVTWTEDAAGITYYTEGQEGEPAVVHYVLATRGGEGWRVSWAGDEAPDWWLSARGGTLAVSPDLARLELSGPGTGTTDAFYEPDGALKRTFTLRWARAANIYQPVPPPEGFEDRTTWLWSVAQPSPYATLVEFIERIQRGDLDGAARLTASDDVMQAAVDFGLMLPQRRFEVSEATVEGIVFRDVQGTLAAEFVLPAGSDTWLIASLGPVGSEIATATPAP